MIFPNAGIGARLFSADLTRFLVDFYRELATQAGLEWRMGS